MHHRLATVAAAFLVVAAGCLGTTGPSDEVTPTDQDPDVLIDANRPRERLGDVVTGPAVGPDLNATTEEPPRLVPGEWWRIRFDTAFLSDEPVEVVRVVADAHENGYVFGMPHEGWLKEAISFHAPGFGDVGLDLSYNTHNMKFEPVRFPLVTGATWDTVFATAPLTATVEYADAHKATIRFTMRPAEPQPTDPLFALLGFAAVGGDMVLTYDAQVHEIVRMESELGVWEVIEHGYDFQGWVTVPRGEDTVIDYGTFGPASETHNPVPREHVVDGGFNRLTMMHFIGTMGDAPGHFRIRDVVPNGTELVTEMTGAGLVLAFHEASDPDGTWVLEDLVAGAGFTYSMGIAYHQYDIRLPDGLRRADHSHHVIR